MDRRDFFKILSTVSAGVATNACGKKEDVLIPLLVANHEIPPGEERWHPAVCTECGAGCGIIARVMEGERVVERNGEKFRERIACVKKLEGNPLDPVSGGRLCARGHAALQSLYNPDRVAGPMRRTSARGNAAFTAISWDESIANVAQKLKASLDDPSKILFLTTRGFGSRSVTVQHFLESIGAPPALTCTLDAFALERQAAASVFGWNGLPRYDLGNACYALSVGADFLGGWTSPVYYARQFGHFRQGRPALRGKLVQAESRMSITAASADEWVPLRPGSEPHFLVAVSRVLLDEKLARNAEELPDGAKNSLLAANLADLIRATGIDEKRVRRIARELGESDSPLAIAGASVVQTNSLDALIASHYLNILLGNIGRPGGVFPPFSSVVAAPRNANVTDAIKQAKVLLLDGANPVYSLPKSSGIPAALAHLDLIVSFGMFIDDSVAYADDVLPTHHPLESEIAAVPAVPVTPISVAIAMPFVQPLHNSRPLEQILDGIAREVNAKFQPSSAASFVLPLLQPDQTWDDVARRGGLWRDNEVTNVASRPLENNFVWRDPVFDGAAEQFPLLFQPYLSLQYHDGRGANLPWMQELPDPVSSSMWDLPVEIDPHTAARLNVTTGDWVQVESPYGALQTTAYVHPAALPGVASMAIGEGHTHYGRYASGRGANPLSIVSPTWDDSVGALAFGATRVRIARLDRPPALIQFSPNDREQGPWGYR
ncbi:MAG TPA: molybdopterin-dependent oxidoreductase [Bryobacteraceae bacterium]|nr:molybdopterin-dependent oxidoreductase [Bryobacteraceae bacterium]